MLEAWSNESKNGEIRVWLGYLDPISYRFTVSDCPAPDFDPLLGEWMVYA